jgi:hypothetical protein
MAQALALRNVDKEGEANDDLLDGKNESKGGKSGGRVAHRAE